MTKIKELREKYDLHMRVERYVSDELPDKAKEYIKEGKLSVNEIAEKLNYSSVYSFSKSFKQKYGFSPTKL